MHWPLHYEMQGSLKPLPPHLQAIDLSQVFRGVQQSQRRYTPTNLVCFYGQHYMAFASIDGDWVSIDDTYCSPVGKWAGVGSKCQRGKLQPSVVFYTTSASGGVAV